MNKNHFNIIVIGLGGTGSAALYHLAQQGLNVLGIDQYQPPHIFGSSHGETRITRLANAEGDEYTQLALRARVLWQELEQISQKKLLVENGGLTFGTPHEGGPLAKDNNFLVKTIVQAEKYNIPHKTFTASQLAAQYPQFKFNGDEIGYLESTAGYLFIEEAITAELDHARQAGAQTLLNTHVIAIDYTANPISVITTHGDYSADKVIVAAGPWINMLLPELSEKFSVYRQTVIWFKLKGSPADYTSDRLPIFKWKFAQGPISELYGFPITNPTDPVIKIGLENYDHPTTMDTYDVKISPATVSELYEQHVKERMPDISAGYTKATACVYTVTKDGKFVIDYHPQNNNLIIASPCSGHGFKHSIAIGELLAGMCQGTVDAAALAPFAW